MNKSPISLKAFLLLGAFSLLVTLIAFFSSIFDTRTTLVFCDVGQGDGAYIRIKNKIDIVIDSGPNRKILDCLGKHMPFYDKKIELAILTHPQSDHYSGFLPIIERYKIDRFILNTTDNTHQSFQKLLDEIKKKKIDIHIAQRKDLVDFKYARLVFYWPPGINNVGNGFKPFPTTDPNDQSLIFAYEENDFRALFTGDAPPAVLNRLIKQSNMKSDILKIPHHGSKNGLTKEFLELADPIVSVISVGRNNAYGHPAKKILDMLKALNKKYLRTDEIGDIIFKIPNPKFQDTNKDQ